MIISGFKVQVFKCKSFFIYKFVYNFNHDCMNNNFKFNEKLFLNLTLFV